MSCELFSHEFILETADVPLGLALAAACLATSVPNFPCYRHHKDSDSQDRQDRGHRDMGWSDSTRSSARNRYFIPAVAAILQNSNIIAPNSPSINFGGGQCHALD